MGWLDNLKLEAQKRGQSQVEDVEIKEEEQTTTTERPSSLEETFAQVAPGLENSLLEMHRELGMESERIESVKAFLGDGGAIERRYFLEPSSRLLTSGSLWSGRSAGYVWQVKHPGGHRFFLVLTLNEQSEPYYLALDEGGRSISTTSGPAATSEAELQNLLKLACERTDAIAR